jgi:hypothetical protein
MDVSQTSVAFASAAAHAQQVQRSVQDERDSVQRATDNSAAADTTDVADLRADAPADDAAETAPPPVAEADDSERAAPERERERERGAVVDLTV